MRKTGLKTSLSHYQVNCRNPGPCLFWPTVFFNYLLFAGLKLQESTWFVIFWVVCCTTMGPSTSEKSLTPCHNIIISGLIEAGTVILVCVFWKCFLSFFFFSCMKIHRLNLWSYIVLLICKNIIDLLQPYLKMFQTFETLQSASNVWVVF